MRIFSILVIVMASYGVSKGTSFGNCKYRVNEANVTALFENSISVGYDPLYEDLASRDQKLTGEKSAAAAFVLAFTVGWLGVHRFYLGTNFGTGLFYVCTLGGCGIVATIDWIFLLIALIEEEDISKYEHNNRVFMW